jgi:undecaprenyl-diphosphatase
MNFFEAFILGSVAGFTELLPISSTAHIIITSWIFDGIQNNFLTSFVIAVQLGALMAICFAFIYQMKYVSVWWKQIIIAFIPTALIGFLGYSFIRKSLTNESLLLWGIGVGGIIIILSEYWFSRKKQEITNESNNVPENNSITLPQAFAIGIFQSFAFFPGISRSASTIIGALWIGVSRKHALEFSFLLALPVIGSAVGYDLLQQSFVFSRYEWLLLLFGTIISAIVAYISILFLRKLIIKHSFAVFGWYRILLTIILVIILF